MALRWTAAGMLGAERQFGRIIGYRELARLAVAIGRDRHPDYPHPDQGGY
jgi:putative transposase